MQLSEFNSPDPILADLCCKSSVASAAAPHGDQHPIKNVNLRVLVPEMVEMGNDVRLIVFPGEDHGFYFGRGSAEASAKAHSEEADAFYRKYVKIQPTRVDSEHLVESGNKPSL